MFKPVGVIYSKPGKDQSLVENKSQGHLGVDCRMTAMEQINAVKKSIFSSGISYFLVKIVVDTYS